MEELRIIARLMAFNIAGDYDSAEELLAWASQGLGTTNTEVKITDEKNEAEVADYLYSLYPSKCPNRNCSTGKCSKDKLRIVRMLKSMSASRIEQAINLYVKECKENGSYMKNFSTFLNNIPDVQEEEEKQPELFSQYQ